MNIRNEFKWMILLAIICFAVFANSIGGEFVYDDLRQILRNQLIQDNSLIWTALTSDVWAFRGDGTIAASNYWRPTFTLLNIICYRLFGAEPAGWHVVNILLHAGVTVLAFMLLRRWSFSAIAAFSIALIFAVHPVHVESVAWIAGSPDLLFSLAFLGSLWFVSDYFRTGSNKYLVISTVLYAIALGAKEIGILCLPIYYFVYIQEQNRSAEEDKPNSLASVRSALFLMATTAAGYFLIRLAILKAFSKPPIDSVGFYEAILSVPVIFTFYLRQIFFPYNIAGNYPLEPVAYIGLTNFIIPAAVSVTVLAGIFYLAKNLRSARLAAAIFLLPLIPAMNAMVFPGNQMVHDRYLYLPILGVLMLLVIALKDRISEKQIMIGAIIISCLLSVKTVTYNTAWANDMALWSWNRHYDDSAFTTLQYGNILLNAERYDEALKEFNVSISKAPQARAYLGRGRVFLFKKEYAKAEQDLLKMVALPPDSLEIYALYQAYESLGIVYTEQGKFDLAIKNFREARERLPLYTAALTEKLAIVLYQRGQKAEALKELENVTDQAYSEMLPESKNVFLRLGMLYAELGKKQEAAVMLREYLAQTAPLTDKNILASREQAVRILNGL